MCKVHRKVVMRTPKGREAGAARPRAVPMLSGSVWPHLGSEWANVQEKKG